VHGDSGRCHAQTDRANPLCVIWPQLCACVSVCATAESKGSCIRSLRGAASPNRPHSNSRQETDSARMRSWHAHHSHARRHQLSSASLCSVLSSTPPPATTEASQACHTRAWVPAQLSSRTRRVKVRHSWATRGELSDRRDDPHQRPAPRPTPLVGPRRRRRNAPKRPETARNAPLSWARAWAVPTCPAGGCASAETATIARPLPPSPPRPSSPSFARCGGSHRRPLQHY
jgi:hypothetical protein